MKKETKNTINKLIERERKGLYGEAIPDSTINNMLDDLKLRNDLLRVLIYFFYWMCICFTLIILNSNKGDVFRFISLSCIVVGVVGMTYRVLKHKLLN